jgi:hypothetical protein
MSRKRCLRCISSRISLRKIAGGVTDALLSKVRIGQGCSVSRIASGLEEHQSDWRESALFGGEAISLSLILDATTYLMKLRWGASVTSTWLC